MIARRYMHDYGATSEDFGRVTVADRRHAASNPRAWFYQRPVTLAEHQESRWIAEPLRLLDCCQESDGAVAIVVTRLDRARDLPRCPAVIAAAAQGSAPGQFIMTSYYRDDLAALPEMGVVARQLWRQAGVGPADVRTAVLYDHFTPYVLIQLEELGFCPRGEARGFISGGAIEVGGRLPLNTHGGQLGEAYIHGMNGIAEAVRQVRGTSVNQVPGDGPVLVTAGTGVPTSGLILSLPPLRPRRTTASIVIPNGFALRPFGSPVPERAGQTCPRMRTPRCARSPHSRTHSACRFARTLAHDLVRSSGAAGLRGMRHAVGMPRRPRWPAVVQQRRRLLVPSGSRHGNDRDRHAQRDGHYRRGAENCPEHRPEVGCQAQH
jgi:Thiolase C-terminal domain-like